MQVVLPIFWFRFIYLRHSRTIYIFLKFCFLFQWDCPFFAINIFNRKKNTCRANSNCKQDKQWSNLIHWYWFQGICSIRSVLWLGHVLNFVAFHFCWCVTYCSVIWIRVEDIVDYHFSDKTKLEIKLLYHETNTYALSYYRSQNVLCRSKFFEPAQNFDCI